MKKYVFIRLSFDALHNWEGCNLDEVNYLKYMHRHIFFVEMWWNISHDDRDIEFISKKMEVETFIDNNWRGRYLKNMSCEMLASRLMEEFNADKVYVSEDNENGAIIEK